MIDVGDRFQHTGGSILRITDVLPNNIVEYIKENSNMAIVQKTFSTYFEGINFKQINRIDKFDVGDVCFDLVLRDSCMINGVKPSGVLEVTYVTSKQQTVIPEYALKFFTKESTVSDVVRNSSFQNPTHFCVMTEYHGFTEAYEYCEVCGKKGKNL